MKQCFKFKNIILWPSYHTISEGFHCSFYFLMLFQNESAWVQNISTVKTLYTYNHFLLSCSWIRCHLNLVTCINQVCASVWVQMSQVGLSPKIKHWRVHTQMPLTNERKIHKHFKRLKHKTTNVANGLVDFWLMAPLTFLLFSFFTLLCVCVCVCVCFQMYRLHAYQKPCVFRNQVRQDSNHVNTDRSSQSFRLRDLAPHFLPCFFSSPPPMLSSLFS